MQTAASVLVQRAERAIHEANPPLPRGGRTDRGQSSSGTTIAGTTVRDIRAVHSKLTDDEFEHRVAEAERTQTPMTRQALKRPRSGNASHDNDDEWYTPPAVVEACRSAMGGIDLDPASNAVANEIVKATRFFDADDDGLSQAWAGRVFLNPPYSKQAGKREFIERLGHHFRGGDVEQACVVLSYDFSPSWFEPLRGLFMAICLFRGRVQFYKERPGDGHDPALGTSVIYLGADVDAFAEAFAGLGDVVVPYERR